MFSESSSHRQSVTNTGYSLISEVPVNTLILAFMGGWEHIVHDQIHKGNYVLGWGKGFIKFDAFFSFPDNENQTV